MSFQQFEVFFGRDVKFGACGGKVGKKQDDRFALDAVAQDKGEGWQKVDDGIGDVITQRIQLPPRVVGLTEHRDPSLGMIRILPVSLLELFDVFAQDLVSDPVGDCRHGECVGEGSLGLLLVGYLVGRCAQCQAQDQTKAQADAPKKQGAIHRDTSFI